MSTSLRHPQQAVTLGIGLLAGLSALAVYAATAYRTSPFWDAGEFIATSAILGIPHQPSTPLYVLIGRLVSLVPVGSVAFRINMLSAVATSLAVVFTFIATEKLARRMESSAGFSVIAGLAAAAFVAFSRTLWFSALEAEVYSLSSMMVALSAAWVVDWAERPPAQRNGRALFLVLYLLSLSIAIHLGTILVLPALLVFVIHEILGSWKRTFTVLAGLGGGLLAMGVAANLAEAMGAGAASEAAGFSAVSLLALVLLPRFRRPAGFLLALFLLGLSVHLFLPIRAHLNPVINEGDPDNWRAFWDTLTRAQYPAPNPLVRRAPLLFQFGPMFLRYLGEQWSLVPARLPGFLAGLKGGWLAASSGLLPLVAAAAGGWMQARRDRSGFALIAVFALVTGPGMVIYLNFSDHEVRERDYFFSGFYQAVAMWAGLGAAPAARALAGPSRPSGVVAGAVVLALAFLPAKTGWFEHDRTRDTIARDYAYNMLAPLPADAILFTNGDNDTFPLWYLQTVEGVRKDVRVVNLSLLNTTWYIRQLRDLEPRVPIRLSDSEIDALVPMVDPATRQLLLTKDLAVRQILKDNHGGRPTYLAVTVPQRMGLDEYMRMEGLTHRIYPEKASNAIDLEKCRHNVYQVFTPLHGILTADGKTDSTLYRDLNETRLIQNYAAIHFYMAAELDRLGKVDEALTEALRAQAVSPGFSGNRIFLGILYEKHGEWAKAEAHYRESIAAVGQEPRLTHRLGWVIAQQGRLNEAVPILKEAVDRGGGGYFDPYASLFEVYLSMGKQGEAVALLDRWLSIHPGDEDVRKVRDRAARGELNAIGRGMTPRLD